MFAPRYTITQRLLANIKQIAILTAEANRRAVPRVVLVELVQRAQALSTHTSTRIEGNPLPLTEVRRLLKAAPRNLRDSEREVVNYNQALQHLQRRIEDGTAGLSLKLVLETHRTVMRGLVDTHLRGRWRAEPVVVNDPRSGGVVYLPPNHQDVRPLMTDLVRYVTAQREAVDPLILAGLFHRQFVIIHPFTDGNGRTARLMTKVLLAAMGLNTFPLFSFENYYSLNVTRYFAAVGVAGNYYDLHVDFTRWLEYFTDGIIAELGRVAGLLRTTAVTPETRLRPHHERILEHLQTHPFITDRDYALLTARAKATRALDFKQLIAWGLIERHGRGKNTHYRRREG